MLIAWNTSVTEWLTYHPARAAAGSEASAWHLFSTVELLKVVRHVSPGSHQAASPSQLWLKVVLCVPLFLLILVFLSVPDCPCYWPLSYTFPGMWIGHWLCCSGYHCSKANQQVTAYHSLPGGHPIQKWGISCQQETSAWQVGGTQAVCICWRQEVLPVQVQPHQSPESWDWRGDVGSLLLHWLSLHSRLFRLLMLFPHRLQSLLALSCKYINLNVHTHTLIPGMNSDIEIRESFTWSACSRAALLS